VVGQQGVFSSTGSFCGRPTTMKVLPRTNLHFNLFFLISSKMIFRPLIILLPLF